MKNSMSKLLVLLILMISISLGSLANDPVQGKRTFTIGKNSFLLDGKPFVIRAGELHYPRIPREYWEHRIQMCKAMGMNTICIYIFWNYHEQVQGEYTFTGQADVAEFVRLIQKNGMYCIVRPGPYVCAEWDMGGLPWWLLKKNNISVRDRNDSFYMQNAMKFIHEVGKQLAPYQLQNGGNIIMVQVENEYAVWGKDVQYMQMVRDEIRKAGFDQVQLLRCDWSSNFNNYQIEGVFNSLNFGAGSNIEEQFKLYSQLYPDMPKMCGEYWSGWFDYWGRPHETRSVNSFIGSMKDMMDQKISFSLYMAHGGTTFGQWGGANSPPYRTNVASYDYDAPISEAGLPTEKFYAVRNLLKHYLNEGESLGDIPAPKPTAIIPEFNLTQTANLFENLPKAIQTENIKPMEMFDQGWGSILYRTKLNPTNEKSKLIITEVHDWALVYINGKLIGKIERRLGENSIDLPVVDKESQLDILVDGMGRVNYDKTIIDRKGITEKVELQTSECSTVLKNWQVYKFPVDYNFQKSVKYKAAKADGPAWYRAEFNLNKVGDTYFDMSKWVKGMVWVNGYNLGRYWKIGPQQTLYMPGCWLKKGKNEMIVFDLEGPTTPKVAGIIHPILDKINNYETMLHRKSGQTLDLSSESPLYTGSFTADGGWKTVAFEQNTNARYVCLEALNSQKNDPFTSLAEIEITDENGIMIPRAKMKLIYADSEEVTSENNSADRVFDNQESTYWHTAFSGQKPAHPHQIVIDLGEVVKIKGFRCLPRTDNSEEGKIKDVKFYAKTIPFKF
jgi:beta-galactosidase